MSAYSPLAASAPATVGASDSSGFSTAPGSWAASDSIDRPEARANRSVTALASALRSVIGERGLGRHRLEGDRGGGLGVHPRATGHEGADQQEGAHDESAPTPAQAALNLVVLVPHACQYAPDWGR